MPSKETDKSNVGADLVFCLFLFAMVVVFFIMAIGYKSVTRHAPMVVLIPLAFLLLLQIALAIKKLIGIKDSGGTLSLQVKIERKNLWRGGQLFLAMITLIIMIYFCGQLFGIALFLILFLRFFSRESWILALSLGIGVTVGLHLLFEKILGIPLYPGAIYKYVSGLIGI
ncbi:MAG: tripartite tricarboxylate transporter TctB family protein [Deltaproteobacteria bacterium]|jgi:hypothetical protein|nr:tripartite tricarboxylate transporter TctB family protein [Deltaproteobacteria bacterium]